MSVVLCRTKFVFLNPSWEHMLCPLDICLHGQTECASCLKASACRSNDRQKSRLHCAQRCGASLRFPPLIVDTIFRPPTSVWWSSSAQAKHYKRHSMDCMNYCTMPLMVQHCAPSQEARAFLHRLSNVETPDCGRLAVRGSFHTNLTYHCQYQNLRLCLKLHLHYSTYTEQPNTCKEAVHIPSTEIDARAT